MPPEPVAVLERPKAPEDPVTSMRTIDGPSFCATAATPVSADDETVRAAACCSTIVTPPLRFVSASVADVPPAAPRLAASSAAIHARLLPRDDDVAAPSGASPEGGESAGGPNGSLGRSLLG